MKKFQTKIGKFHLVKNIELIMKTHRDFTGLAQASLTRKTKMEDNNYYVFHKY